MNSHNRSDAPNNLPATVSISAVMISPLMIGRNLLGTQTPILPRGAKLPTEATHVVSNTDQAQWDLQVFLYYGGDAPDSRRARFGPFATRGIPPLPKGPPQIHVRISVGTDQELRLAVNDLATKGYRSIGFVNLSGIEPRAAMPPSFPPIFDPRWLVKNIATVDARALYRSARLPSAVKHISQEISIPLEEALNGAEKTIEVDRYETCPTCAGSGTQPGTSVAECTVCQGTGSEKIEVDAQAGKAFKSRTCRTCGGTGQTIPYPCVSCEGSARVKTRRPFTFHVPPGIDSGARICFPKQGQLSQERTLGDLYITVAVLDDPLFTRNGSDISIHLPVTTNFVKRGGQLQIPGVDKGSFFLLNVPPNTRSGATFHVLGNESYTLSAVIHVYNPRNPWGLLEAQRRLYAIRKALNGRDYEVRT